MITLKYFYIYIIFELINFIMNSKIYNILKALDSDIRKDIFIGLTGLMIATIIFIVEVINNKKHEFEKSFILDKTKIIKNMFLCISIFFIMLISSTIKYSGYNSMEDIYIINDILYIILQLLINSLLFIFMYKTFNIFRIAVKLNIYKEYFNKELDSYINKRSKELEIKSTEKNLKNINRLNQHFKKYLEKNKKISDDVLSVGLSYVPIYENKSGIIKNYNYRALDSMLENVDDNFNMEPKNYVPPNVPIFVFAKKIGDFVEKGSVVAYCLNGYKQIFEYFLNCIIYDKNSVNLADEINKINIYLFELASNFSAPYNFDDDRKLFSYFNFLYQNNLNEIRSSFISYLKEVVRIVCNDKYKNYNYAAFLNRILSLAYNNDNYNEYQQISKLICSLYIYQLKIDDNDIKKVAYNFANNYFKYNYFSINKNSDIRYYDELMSNLLSFIYNLIKRRNFDAISILFKNIMLDHDSDVSDDFDEKNICNLKFSIGILQCLYILIEKDKEELTDEDKKNIKNIIDWTKKYFINTYDAWKVIINFKKYYGQESSIQRVYNYFEIDFINHDYLSSWSGYLTDDITILREFLYTFKIQTVFKDNINYDEITKDDSHYFNNLLETISSNSKTKYEEELNLNYSNDKLIEALELVIKDSKNKEKEYIRSHKLDETKKRKFKKIIKEKIQEKRDLEKYLNNLNKVEKIDMKIKRVCGVNQLIPRNLFFENYGGCESFAEECSRIFNIAKEKEFIKKIDSISLLEEKSIDDILNSLENIEDYLLITNHINYYHIKAYDGFSDYVLINNKKIDILKISNLKFIYLIEKKYLPKLQYCDFEDNLNKNNIEESLYYELNDCSTEDKLRNEIIENSNWLSEIGNIEKQHEYLKEKCRLRVLYSFRFYEVDNATAIKFKVKE